MMQGFSQATSGMSGMFSGLMISLAGSWSSLISMAMAGISKLASLIGGLFSGGAGAKANDARDAWIASMGGWSGIEAILNDWNSPALNNTWEMIAHAGTPELVQQAIDAFNQNLQTLIQFGHIGLPPGFGTVDPNPPSGLPPQEGFASGTRGFFHDFGRGTSVMLHGRERVMTEDEAAGSSIVFARGAITIDRPILKDREAIAELADAIAERFSRSVADRVRFR